jgi:hypothetical protein
MPIETVILLGAGASAAEGAPLQANLFREYFEALHGRRPGRSFLQEMNRELESFFNLFFGLDVKSPDIAEMDFPTFEEALGVLELALQRGESFRSVETFLRTNHETRSAQSWLQQVRENLIFLICLILEWTIKETRDKKNGCHGQLMQSLQQSGDLEKTSFLSINYDILIDDALTDLVSTYDLDYGVEFTNFDSPDDWRRPQPGRAIFLAKLHGSLNWLYCPACTRLTLTPRDGAVILLKLAPKDCYCPPPCSSSTVPIVIPPTFFKVMTNFHLQQVWRKAEDHLMAAKRLVFCGYSLPDADMHIKYLLKRVEVNRSTPVEVYIVNNHPDKEPSQQREEERRYRRLFRERNRVHYTTLSFADFAAGGLALLDQSETAKAISAS